MFKLRFYKLTGPNKGNTDHEETYSSINDMFAAYHEAVKEIPPFQALEPTIWIYQDDINGYIRLFWGDEYNGKTVNDQYSVFVNMSETETETETDYYDITTYAPAVVILIDRHIKKYGGYREREILSDPHTYEVSCWNDEHKIIDVLKCDADPDGHRDGFSFDLVTKTICG